MFGRQTQPGLHMVDVFCSKTFSNRKLRCVNSHSNRECGPTCGAWPRNLFLWTMILLPPICCVASAICARSTLILHFNPPPPHVVCTMDHVCKRTESASSIASNISVAAKNAIIRPTPASANPSVKGVLGRGSWFTSLNRNGLWRASWFLPYLSLISVGKGTRIPEIYIFFRFTK